MKKNGGSRPRGISPDAANPDVNDSQAKFLLAAIQDAQAVIRATDSKVAALSFGLAVPLTKLGAIWSVCSQLIAQAEGFGEFCAGLVILIFSASWVVSIMGAIRTLLHVDNPAKHISGDRPTGVFYSPTLFQPALWDLFFPRRLDSTAQFSAFFDQLPSSDREIRRELAFELMKLVYIRTMKLRRATITYWAFSAWVTTGGAIWILQLILKKYGS